MIAVGPNIKEDLVAVLHHKLNEKVVEIISILLGRNPMCKLSAEDVVFLQAPGSLPSQTVRFKVSIKSMLKKSVFVHAQGIKNVPAGVYNNPLGFLT